MSTLVIVLLVVYVIGFFWSLPFAYAYCKEGYDYGSQNLTYNGTGAFGLSLFWFIFWPMYRLGKHYQTTA